MICPAWVAPFYEEPIDELAGLTGVEHVLFGSDYPHPEGLADPLAFLDDLSSFGPDDQQRIMSGNLKALLAPMKRGTETWNSFSTRPRTRSRRSR